VHPGPKAGPRAAMAMAAGKLPWIFFIFLPPWVLLLLLLFVVVVAS
jgi:hypothetical protein